MSHPDTLAHPTHDGDRPYFPASEWEQFQKDDITTAKAIVLLMGGIFTIGLILYMIVAFTVAATPFYLA